MTRRRGVSLTEALIAIFIMAIGLIALLTLFPMAALQMAQAIKDDRCGTAGNNGTVAARLFWRDIWLSPTGAEYPEATVVTNYPELNALDNPNAAYGAAPNPQGAFAPLTATDTVPSYPVFIDPIGWFSQGSKGPANQWWVAGYANGVARRPLSSLNTPLPGPRLRACALLDDMTFDGNGAADMSTGSVPRGCRYNWGYFIKRSNNNIRDAVDVTVVVYSGRAADVAPDEFALPATFAQGSTYVSLNLNNGPRPPLRRGNWILDASPPSNMHGQFYRVIGINEAGGRLDLELQTPIRGPSMAGDTGVIIIFDTLAEVFNRGTITPYSLPSR